ncbi:MAG: peptidoglycan-binding protein [Clostridia bacterium]|nr:peptidoglycan-binding protein [Clostridia bacterium]
MSTGRLQVNIFSETVGFPLEGSSVTITNSKTKNIIENLTTNSSGNSDIINLETPPEEYSMQPNSPQPYTEYTINVSKEGFDPVTIENIQVLPNTTAVQNVFMKKTNENNIQDFVYPIPPHTLYGDFPPKIAESPVKTLPVAEGFVILDKIVVPEYIVVHDGNPDDDSAPNYWIPYKDYIKNVASSEIYATWPEECIKANILTITSFTLNRVYTEWYRSRGKNFTVTSTTAYDQKFVYQRNIFEEISNIVDEMFSLYITKPQIEQPLFTQYCDGKNVTCPGWLSQWGSKELAENGLNYIDILRTYYGTEIYTEYADQIAGVPISFPGNALESGSVGENVRTIQRQLNSISNNYPAINKIAVDGVYGQSTVDAVKKFQEIFNLPQTGSVDYATWYEISKVYAAVMRLA